MNYKAKLEEKKLKKEDLSQKTQKKIDSLETLLTKIEQEASSLTEEKADEYEELVNSFDEEITDEIEKFNPEVYKKRLEVAAKARESRVATAPKEKKSELAPIRNISNESKPNESIELNEKRVKIEKFDDHLEKENKERNRKVKFVENSRNKYQNDESEPEIEDFEAQEFEKKLQIRQGNKLNSIGWGLFSAGLFLMTFGGVMVWKNKK